MVRTQTKLGKDYRKDLQRSELGLEPGRRRSCCWAGSHSGRVSGDAGTVGKRGKYRSLKPLSVFVVSGEPYQVLNKEDKV